MWALAVRNCKSTGLHPNLSLFFHLIIAVDLEQWLLPLEPPRKRKLQSSHCNSQAGTYYLISSILRNAMFENSIIPPDYFMQSTPRAVTVIQLVHYIGILRNPHPHIL